MRKLQNLLASFLMGLLPVGLSALVVLIYKGMFIETLLVSSASTLIGALIMTDRK